MVVAVVSILIGLALLAWSADRFVDGAAAVARHYGLSPLLIGMVIVGFGTSVPEMLVSAFAAFQGSPGIAFGNAYGSNITNIALILGVTAIIHPIAVHSRVLRKELPLLTCVTVLAICQLLNGTLSRLDAAALIGVFTLLMIWSFRQDHKNNPDTLGNQIDSSLDRHPLPLKPAVQKLVIGLSLLIVSSRLLVWGAVGLARSFGVSDLIIGLTIVAVGTSLPELASSFAASMKNEHDIALGNIIGSNLFNTLVVVGLAGLIHPMQVVPGIMTRDLPVMGTLTLSLFLFGYGFKGRPGRINRLEGGILLLAYAVYTVSLIAGRK